MASASPSPIEGDTTEKRTDTEVLQRHFEVDFDERDTEHERITDVRDLDVGDELLVGDRKRPITVHEERTREIVPLRGDPLAQLAIEAAGDWDDAVDVLLANRVSLSTGERRGEIGKDKRDIVPVWRVDE